jgi:hypothetical protein
MDAGVRNLACFGGRDEIADFLQRERHICF